MSTEAIGTPQNGRPSRWMRINKSDLAITLVLLVAFTGAFVMATGWSGLAAYFPLGVSGVGAVTSLVFLIRVVFFPRSQDAPKTNAPKDGKPTSEREYEFFASLTARDWLTSIGWLGGFYVVLGIFGIYVAMIAFTIGYLRLQVNKSWLFCAIYTALLVGTTFGVFELALHLPLPGGLFGLA